MKSQLLTTLSIVGVLGTATTAMAANTDVLASLDSPEIGSATEVLLPATSSSTEPGATDPTATPAPTDPSATPAPSPSTSSSTTSGNGQAPSGGTAPVAQPATAPVVNGTSGGSGSRVAPSAAVPGATTYNDDDDEDHEDEEHEEEHEEDDD